MKLCHVPVNDVDSEIHMVSHVDWKRKLTRGNKNENYT